MTLYEAIKENRDLAIFAISMLFMDALKRIKNGENEADIIADLPEFVGGAFDVEMSGVDENEEK